MILLILPKVTGQILYRGIDVNRPEINVYEMRKHIGMVFNVQIPLPSLFTATSLLLMNVQGVKDKKVLDEIVETSLRQAAPLGSGQRRPSQISLDAFWRSAATSLYRSCHLCQTRYPLDG